MSDARAWRYSFRKRPFKAIVSVVVVWFFLVNTLSCDLAWAANDAVGGSSERLASSGARRASGEKELRVDTFELPQELGTVRDSWTGSGTTVIHI